MNKYDECIKKDEEYSNFIKTFFLLLSVALLSLEYRHNQTGILLFNGPHNSFTDE